MNIKNNSFIKLLRMYIRKFNKYDVPGLTAEMSFYLLTTLFPFVILIFIIATLISSTMQEMMLSVITYLPRDMEALITELIMSFKGSMPIIIICAVLALWYMSNVIATLTKAMNRFYGLKETRGYLKQRLVYLFFAVSIIMLIFLSFALIIFGQGTQVLLEKVSFLEFIDTEKAWDNLRYALFILVIIITMTMMFAALPNKKLTIKNVIGGSALTTVAWCVASYGFAFYVNYFARYHIIYGSLASIIILVTWVYLSSLVILLGASLNAFWYRLSLAKKYNISTSSKPLKS